MMYLFTQQQLSPTSWGQQGRTACPQLAGGRQHLYVFRVRILGHKLLNLGLHNTLPWQAEFN